MRGLCLFALPLLLSGCGGEPDFDERYRRKAGEMENAATVMQQELANRMAASNIVEAAEAPPPPVPGSASGEEKAR